MVQLLQSCCRCTDAGFTEVLSVSRRPQRPLLLAAFCCCHCCCGCRLLPGPLLRCLADFNVCLVLLLLHNALLKSLHPLP